MDKNILFFILQQSKPLREILYPGFQYDYCTRKFISRYVAKLVYFPVDLISNKSALRLTTMGKCFFLINR